MPDVDTWLAESAKRTSAPLAADFLEALDRKLAAEPEPMVLSSRREVRRTMLCASVAALLGFTASASFADGALAKHSPTWVAAPSADSPFALLVGK